MMPIIEKERGTHSWDLRPGSSSRRLGRAAAVSAGIESGAGGGRGAGDAGSLGGSGWTSGGCSAAGQVHTTTASAGAALGWVFVAHRHGGDAASRAVDGVVLQCYQRTSSLEPVQKVPHHSRRRHRCCQLYLHQSRIAHRPRHPGRPRAAPSRHAPSHRPCIAARRSA